MDDLPKVVALDANALICLCGKECDDRLKLEHLFSVLDKQRGIVILPTPSVSEFLIGADQAAHDMMEVLQNKASVRICPFDLAGAYECAQMNAAAIGRSGGNKRDGIDPDRAWQQVKFDRQIVAIAKSNGARLIISNDSGVRACSQRVGIKTLRVDELPFPDHARQAQIPLEVEQLAEED